MRSHSFQFEGRGHREELQSMTVDIIKFRRPIPDCRRGMPELTINFSIERSSKSTNIRAFAIFAHWLPAVNIVSGDNWGA